MADNQSLPERTPNCEFSPHSRTRIAVGYSLGLTPRALFAKEGVVRGSLYHIVKRYEKQKSGRSLPRSGRPRKLDDRAVRKILRSIANDPFVTLKKIKVEAELDVSERTISRELIRRGIMHSRALRRPKLTEEHAAKRLAFARAYVGKPSSWWRRVVVSDESTVARGQGERQLWVFCRQVRCF